jgi:signal transduction histidine kinase
VVIAISRDQMDHLLSTSPGAARTMLHTVIMRLQQTEALLRQSEKMAQLGTFTAGIAHEINNPSAAVQRGAEQLKKSLEQFQTITLNLRLRLVEDEYIERYQSLRREIYERATKPILIDAGARFDREAALESWLEENEVEESWELAPELVNLGYEEASLAKAVAGFPPDCLPVLLEWMIAEAENQRLVEEIHQGARRIADIIKALKSYVYLDQAPRQKIDLHEGLENTLVILRHKLKQGIEIVREYDQAIPPLSAYGSELNQVWTNIIDNAIDALDGKGQILLRTRMQDSQVIVEIEDNGPGIPPEVQPKLFYPFFTTKPVGKGTGLGLNISYQIVQKHGGDIRVFSHPGQTRFEIRLPLEESSRGK